MKHMDTIQVLGSLHPWRLPFWDESYSGTSATEILSQGFYDATAWAWFHWHQSLYNSVCEGLHGFSLWPWWQYDWRLGSIYGRKRWKSNWRTGTEIVIRMQGMIYCVQYANDKVGQLEWKGAQCLQEAPLHMSFDRTILIVHRQHVEVVLWSSNEGHRAVVSLQPMQPTLLSDLSPLTMCCFNQILGLHLSKMRV